MTEHIGEETREAFIELCEKADFRKGALIVIGGSTSEVRGNEIGKNGSSEIGNVIATVLMEEAKARELRLAFQCCEHLNRALVVEKETAENLHLREVSVVPWLHAGGALATAAFYLFSDPVITEGVKADGGLDIGLTMIGMHLKRVAVPIRLERHQIGAASVVAAKTRPPLIGGERARYGREVKEETR